MKIYEASHIALAGACIILEHTFGSLYDKHPPS